jgi:hypothetical protein
MNLKKTGKIFTNKLVGTGPSKNKKRIYRAAVSQRLRNTDTGYVRCLVLKTGSESVCLGFFIFSLNSHSLFIQLASYFSVVSSAVETFVVLWDEPVYSLFIFTGPRSHRG